VLVAGAAFAARPARAALPVPTGDRLAFRLIRHGDDIGRHTLTFDRHGDTLTVRVEVTALVTLLSIPIVRYSHRVVETWQGDALVAVTGETNKNGTREWVDARRTGEGLVVTGSKTARYIAPEPAIGTSYWNKRMLDGPMISLEDGALLKPKVAAEQAEPIRTASGRTIEAARFALRGAFNVDVWYDLGNVWAGLAFDVADGSQVRYERL
jgi:hypothetical protein